MPSHSSIPNCFVVCEAINKKMKWNVTQKIKKQGRDAAIKYNKNHSMQPTESLHLPSNGSSNNCISLLSYCSSLHL